MESTGGDLGKPKFEIALTVGVVVTYLFGHSSRRRGAPSLPSGASGNYLLRKVPTLRIQFTDAPTAVGHPRNRTGPAQEPEQHSRGRDCTMGFGKIGPFHPDSLPSDSTTGTRHNQQSRLSFPPGLRAAKSRLSRIMASLEGRQSLSQPQSYA